MLTLAADLHQAQITYVVADDAGTVIERGRVATRGTGVDRLLRRLLEKSDGQVVVGFEECGFGLWLHEMAVAYGCRVVKIQPLKKQRQKTDKRDAAKMSELLTVNLRRILDGEPLLELRRVEAPPEDMRQARVLGKARENLKRTKHRVLCNIADIPRRFNLQHDCPGSMYSKRGRAWLTTLELPDADRSTLDLLTKHLDFLDDQIAKVDVEIKKLARANAACAVIQTIHGAAELTALGLVSRIGSIDRFRRPGSLVNFFGLAPGQDDSGETTGRIGQITKRGNSYARFLLG